jgi:hypothetical protein
MTNPHSEQRDSTNLYHFQEDTFARRPHTDKFHHLQNRTMSETELKNPKSGEKAPGLSNYGLYSRAL